jgi:hypothetical protein
MEKRLTPHKPKKPTIKRERPLNIQQEAFAQLYGNFHSPYFGNATLAYVMAYKYELDPSKTKSRRNEKENTLYNQAGIAAARLLGNVKVAQRAAELAKSGMTEELVDFELHKLIKQDWDLSNKARGIEIFNDLKGRIIKKSEVNNKHVILGIIKHAYEEAAKPEELNGNGNPGTNKSA